MNKILLAAGLLAMATTAQADCTSAVNGFYGAVKVGYGVTTAKDKITTKAAKITGKKSYRELGGVKFKSGETLKALSAAEAAEYQKWQQQLEAYNDLITGKATGKSFGAEWFYGAWQTNPGCITVSQLLGDLNLNEEDDNNMKAAANDFLERMKAVESELANAGVEFQVDGKKIELANADNVAAVVAHDSGANASKDRLSVIYTLAENKTLDLVVGGVKVNSLHSRQIGSAEEGKNLYGIQLFSLSEINPFGAGDADDAGYPGHGDKGALERNLAEFKAKILGAAVSGKYPGVTVAPTEGTVVTSNEGYSEEIKATVKEVRSHKNNMNIGLSVGYQHAFGVFYTGVELGAEFTPGKTKIQNVAVDGSKVHHLGASTFTYDKEIPAPVPEISLKTKYSFSVTPMFGITTGNWMFYIPVNLKFTKYDLSVTPSSSFSGITLPTVSYPETEVTRTNPYLTDAKVAVDGTTDNTTDNNTTAKTEEAKERTMSTFKKGKTKFGFEIGLGARVMLSKNVFVGVRYMYSPKTTLKIDTPAYSSNVLNDMHRLGANHKVSVSSHKGVLEIGYKF